ncbi:unnamed protein product, partial [Closterium sp. Naga37s-1]
NPIFVCKNLTVNLTIVDCNDSAARILRVAQNERSTRIFGQSPVVFSPPVQPEGILSAVASEQRWLDIATSNGRPFRFPWVHMSIDGQMFLVEVMAMVLVDGPDTFHITMWKQYLNSSSLTRELRLAARAKRAAERSRVQFLANMSHELRTPINGVLGYAQLMMQTQLDPEQQSYLQSIYESGEVLLGTVSQVLEMSQLQKREVVPRQVRFDLHRAIGEAAGSMRPLAHRKGLQVGAAGCRAIGEATGSMRPLAHRKGLQVGADGCCSVLFGISMDRAVPHAVLGDPSMLHVAIRPMLHALVPMHLPLPPLPPPQFGISMDRAVPHAVLGDPSMLRQLLLHLLSNALKFTHQAPCSSPFACWPLLALLLVSAAGADSLASSLFSRFGISMDRAVPHAVLGDPSMLRQLLLHLLSNALKFTHQGTVQLTIRVLAPPGAAAGSAAGADSLASSLFSRVPPSLWQFGISMDRAVPHAVLGDPSMLRQLLLHLLSNALKFTHQGTVQLTVHVLAPPGAAAGAAGAAGTAGSGGGVGAGGKQRGVGRRVSQVMGNAGEGLQGGLVGRELQEQEGKQEQQQAEQVQEQEQQEEEACSAADSQAVWGRSEGEQVGGRVDLES